MISKSKILKKKRMLDLMIKRKLSPQKKQIIKTYGKDMIAEMYLDLVNLTGIKGKSFKRRSNEINKKEFEDTSFQFVDRSMFNQTHIMKGLHHTPKTLASYKNKSMLRNFKNKSLVRKYRPRSVRAKNSRYKKKTNNEQWKIVSILLINYLE